MGFIKVGSWAKRRAVSTVAEAKQSVSSSLIRHQENSVGKDLLRMPYLWMSPQLAVMPEWALEINSTRAALLLHHISFKQPVMLRHILWKPSLVVFIACRILVLTYTSDICEGSDMFSQSGQRNVSSDALVFFGLALAAKGSASLFVDSAECQLSAVL